MLRRVQAKLLLSPVDGTIERRMPCRPAHLTTAIDPINQSILANQPLRMEQRLNSSLFSFNPCSCLGFASKAALLSFGLPPSAKHLTRGTGPTFSFLCNWTCPKERKLGVRTLQIREIRASCICVGKAPMRCEKDLTSECQPPLAQPFTTFSAFSLPFIGKDYVT